jgi:CDP-diglyceride synthetase
MVIIVALGLESVLFVRYFPSVIADPSVHESWFNSFDNFKSCSFATYGLIGTFFTDIGAYFVGVFFGKHKMNERISPKKELIPPLLK